MTNTSDSLSPPESVPPNHPSLTSISKIKPNTKDTTLNQLPVILVQTEETKAESRAEGRRRLRKATKASQLAQLSAEKSLKFSSLQNDSNVIHKTDADKQLNCTKNPRPEECTKHRLKHNYLSFPQLLCSKSTSTTQTPRTTMSSSSSRTVALLVASLGNPPPYHSTRHSAAHIVLKNLQSNLALPPFINKHKLYGGGHVSLGADVDKPEFTLWQSPSLMNVSGTALLQAYKNFLNVHRPLPNDPISGLVVLHDEMEIEPGKFKVRRGGNTSAKGHNGIKSVQASLSGGGLLNGLGDRFVKIGIGIGRPSGGSRDPKDVSAYVLGQLTSREKDGLESVAKDVEGILYQEMRRMMQKQQ